MLFSLFFSAQNSLAQESCGTDDYSDSETTPSLPWYGNDTYLPRYMDSLQRAWVQQSGGRSGSAAPSYTIPVQFIVLLAPGEVLTTVVPPVRFANLITALNQAYPPNGIPFHFTMLCVKTVQPTVTTVGYGVAGSHIDNNRTAGAINVLISVGYTGIFAGSIFWHPTQDGICLTRTTGSSASSAKNFAHEAGHYFGLKHTHLGHAAPYNLPLCYQEQVRRGFCQPPGYCAALSLGIDKLYCSKTGDFLCDTQADQGPDKAAAGVVADWFGDPYQPDKSNYMSYWPSSGYATFSQGQRAIILRNFGKRNGGSIKIKNLEVDDYEIDDFDATAKEIKRGQTQIHTMYNAIDCQSDIIDMVYFEAKPFVGSYFVETKNIVGTVLGNINIFTAFKSGSGVQRISDITSGVIVTNGGKNIEIPCNLLNSSLFGSTFCLIEINKSPNPAGVTSSSGQYSVALSQSYQPQLTPNTTEVCVGAKFSIDGLTPNGSVQWMPENVILSNNNQQTTQVLGSTGSGLSSITAIIEENGCSMFVPVTPMVFTVSDKYHDPMIKNVTSYGVYNNCKSFKYKFNASITGATYVDWKTTCGPSSGCSMTKISDTEVEVSGDFISWDGNKGTYIEVTVVATNACGVSTSYTYKTSFSRGSCLGTDGGGRDNIELAPNPTKTTTTIKMTPKEEVGKEGVVRFIQIVNPVSGVQYEQKTDAAEIELDVSSFMDGVYYVLVSRDGETSQAVLVVQKE